MASITLVLDCIPIDILIYSNGCVIYSGKVELPWSEHNSTPVKVQWHSTEMTSTLKKKIKNTLGEKYMKEMKTVIHDYHMPKA